ncbi:MAG: transposase [Bacteroidetes bacterium]|nr:transposase [Bacteroidota bacterium]
MISKQHPEFLTVTCLNWVPILLDKEHKEIVIESLCYLVKEGRAKVFCFVLMDTHFHLIWQVMGDHKKEAVQRDFLKFTAQQILKNLRNIKSTLLNDLLVEAKDRKYQVWERNSLSVELHHAKVANQKIEYIHYNPVEAGICKLPEEYKYSSAKFYETGEKTFDWLTHYDE